MPVSVKMIQRLAGFELNALRRADVLGPEFDKVRVPSLGTPVYDINGTVLFYRLPLKQGRSGFAGYTDIAGSEVLGEPLLSVTMGQSWDEKALLEEAAVMVRKKNRSIRFNKIRFVAYSYPKIALQYLQDGKEVLMLEWKSWIEVPPKSTDRKPMEISNFERWSLIDEIPQEIRKERIRNFKKRQVTWESEVLHRIDPTIINKEVLSVSKIVLKLVDTREIHYSPRPADHHPCYELRGQQTSVWCVAASVEMLLNFYRYNYQQPVIADDLDLGTCDDPNGLPYGDEHMVVDTIEKFSSNALDATAISNPGWSVYTTEIRANRPLISFIPGHSRTVAGYTHHLLHLPGEIGFHGLLVYDPWPPTDCAHPEAGGVITKWENFNTHTYRYAFKAVLKHV